MKSGKPIKDVIAASGLIQISDESELVKLIKEIVVANPKQVEQFKAGDLSAVKSMQEHTDYLGHGIASFVNTFAPQRVVVGGGISEAGQFYIDMIKESAFKYAMPDCAVNTEIVAAILGNKAGFLGAASLVFKNNN